IEGTICSISFVKDTLFPYAISALPSVLAQKWHDPEFKSYRDAFPSEAQTSPEAFEAHVRDLMARDVKVAYLKNLQGYLWKDGYRNKVYATSLFPDVVPRLKAWRDAGLGLAIFSSGSVFAQKLLFEHVKRDDGGGEHESVDLRGLVRGWYDTVNAGGKMEAGSYGKIARELQARPGEVLFLSDNVKEVAAALGAGMKAVVVDRPGNAPLTEDDRGKFEVITSLEAVDIQAGGD
ncbi:HAD-like domain-containing protein, partial [Elsinoe ampelina]